MNSKRIDAIHVPHISASFVKAGEMKSKKTGAHNRPGLLSRATDWRSLVDYASERIIFPPEICATVERPDIVIWSCSLKVVILIELTVPAEEGIEAAQIRKQEGIVNRSGKQIGLATFSLLRLVPEVFPHLLSDAAFVSLAFRIELSAFQVNSGDSISSTPKTSVDPGVPPNESGGPPSTRLYWKELVSSSNSEMNISQWKRLCKRLLH